MNPKKLYSIGSFIFFLVIFFPVLAMAKGQTLEKCHWRFFLQPFPDTKIFLNKRKIQRKIIYKDKTLALTQIEISDKIKNNFLLIEFKNKNFTLFKKWIYVNQKPENECRQKFIPFYQLESPKSNHSLIGYIKTGKWPKSVTFISKNRVVVPLLQDKGINVINILNGNRQKVFPPYKKYGRYKGLVESVFIPEKNEFWVSQMTKRVVHVFSSKNLSYKTTISLKGIWPKVLVFDPFRKRVYCSNWISKNISVIDINTHKELYRIKTYGVPRGMVLSKNGRFLYVAQFSIKIKYDYKGKILKINLDKNKIVKRFGINGSKRHLALDKKNRLYVSDIHSSRIEIYDAYKGKLIKVLKVFNNPNTIVLSKDEKYLYISCRGPNNPVNYKWKGSKFGRILLLNTQSLKVEEVIETGNQPTGLAISNGGKYLVTSDFLDNRIRVYKIKR